MRWDFQIFKGITIAIQDWHYPICALYLHEYAACLNLCFLLLQIYITFTQRYIKCTSYFETFQRYKVVQSHTMNTFIPFMEI